MRQSSPAAALLGTASKDEDSRQSLGSPWCLCWSALEAGGRVGKSWAGSEAPGLCVCALELLLAC